MADISKINVNGTVYDIKDDVSTRAAGIIYPFGGSVIPHGFLACDGASYLRSSYPELFAVIGTTYGAADSTHFNVPDLRGRFPLGTDGSTLLGASGGEETHTLTVEEMPSHRHELTGFWGGSNSGPAGTMTTSNALNAGELQSKMTNVGGGAAHNNMPPYQVISYIISTGESGLSVQDVITDITTLPLAVQYGGTGANNAAAAMGNLNVYSTSEQRAGTWADGKPLYRQVMSVSYSGSSEVVVPLGSTTNIINVRANLRSGSMLFQVGGSDSGGSAASRWYVQSGSLKLHFDSAFSSLGGTIEIVFEYTKTTD